MEGFVVVLVCALAIGSGILGWKSWGWTKRFYRKLR